MSGANLLALMFTLTYPTMLLSNVDHGELSEISSDDLCPTVVRTTSLQEIHDIQSNVFGAVGIAYGSLVKHYSKVRIFYFIINYH